MKWMICSALMLSAIPLQSLAAQSEAPKGQAPQGQAPQGQATTATKAANEAFAAKLPIADQKDFENAL